MLTGSSVSVRMPSQAAIALLGILLLEVPFLLMRRLGNLELYVVEFIAAALGSGVAYLLCLYLFEHSRDTRAGRWFILGAAVLFRLTLLPLAPTLSEDLYRYRWDGRIQLAGWNPYLVRPDDPRLRGLHELRESHFPGSDIPAIYPPLAELTFRASARFLPSPRRFKLPIAAADFAILFLLAVWLHQTGGRNYQLAVYAWNPLAVVEFAGSGHSDALALAALLAAFVIIRSRPALSTLGLAAAALLKSFPVMLFPAWLRSNGWPARRQAWGGGFAALALATLCFWPYRSAIGEIHHTIAYYASRWQNNNASLYAVLAAFGRSHEFAAGVGAGVVLGLALWTAARRMDPIRAAYLIIGAILIFTPNAYSWYFTWIIPFLCFFPNPAWLLLTILQFLSYEVLINYQACGQFQFNPRYVFLTYAPFYALLLGEFLWKNRPGSKPITN